MKAQLNIHNIGFEFGYQMIFYDRISLDLILFGPSYSYYSGNFRLDGEITVDETELYNKIKDEISDSFPVFYNILLNSEIRSSGGFYTNGFGFRYVVQIGFLF